MKICFLTQTASDISAYYKEFFHGLDLFFVTFKTRNPAPNCVGFVPNSTWSEGRNALYEAVKGQYDYYMFVDDDLSFQAFTTPFSFSPLLAYAWYRIRRQNFWQAFQPTTPAYFVARLTHYLHAYQPEVAYLLNVPHDDTSDLATAAMRHNSWVKRTGHFDAMTTIFSDYGASKILPYDSKISGWWSAQIPVYLYAHHVFKSKALSLIELGAANTNVRANYRPGYDGVADCKHMLAEITKVTGKDYAHLAGGGQGAVDLRYGAAAIRQRIPMPGDQEDYIHNYHQSLAGLELLLHSAIQP